MKYEELGELVRECGSCLLVVLAFVASASMLVAVIVWAWGKVL